jgi:hypothetical protein
MRTLCIKNVLKLNDFTLWENERSLHHAVNLGGNKGTNKSNGLLDAYLDYIYETTNG